MEEGKQTNLSSYFSNLKRSASDSPYDKLDLLSNSYMKREKKSEIIKMGDCSNYTINKFFHFTKEESCLNEIKSGLKKLELTSKILLSNNISEFSTNVKSSLISANIKSYFKSGNRISLSNESEINLDKNLTENINEDHKVFSLDHFEYSERKIHNKKFINEDSVNKENEKINGNLGNFVPQNLVKNPKYEDTKITTWVKYTTYSDLNGINETIFQNILKYMSFKELTQSQIISKTFHNFYKNTLTSYVYFHMIDTSKIWTKKEFTEMLKKGKNLKHIQILNELIRNDFGGEKQGPDSFYSKVIVIMSISSVEDFKYKGTLLDSFKIKPKKDCHINNFISNESMIKICQSSRFTLRDLSLRGCFKLTNKMALNGIHLCVFLERLEISFNNQIDDEAIEKISQNCPNLKVLNLSNLKLITDKSVRSISLLKHLEGLDLSENFNIKGDSLYSLQNCTKINRLILNGIKLVDKDFVFTDYLKELQTLSITNVKTVTNDCLITIGKNCLKLVNLKMDKNRNFSEEAIFEIVNIIKSLRLVISDQELVSMRIKGILDSRNFRN